MNNIPLEPIVAVIEPRSSEEDDDKYGVLNSMPEKLLEISAAQHCSAGITMSLHTTTPEP